MISSVDSNSSLTQEDIELATIALRVVPFDFLAKALAEITVAIVDFLDSHKSASSLYILLGLIINEIERRNAE